MRLSAAQQDRPAAAAPIEFSAQALLQILDWAQGQGVTDPPEWRRQLPYELAREQAKWSGTPSPDLEVERQLRLIHERKQKDPGASFLADTAKFAARIMQGRQEFLSWAVPHLRACLPAGTPIRGTVALAAFLPNYAFPMNETIVVSITDNSWDRTRAGCLICWYMSYSTTVSSGISEASLQAMRLTERRCIGRCFGRCKTRGLRLMSLIVPSRQDWFWTATV